MAESTLDRLETEILILFLQWLREKYRLYDLVITGTPQAVTTSNEDIVTMYYLHGG